jgi:hypothetical protein
MNHNDDPSVPDEVRLYVENQVQEYYTSLQFAAYASDFEYGHCQSDLVRLALAEDRCTRLEMSTGFESSMCSVRMHFWVHKLIRKIGVKALEAEMAMDHVFGCMAGDIPPAPPTAYTTTIHTTAATHPARKPTPEDQSTQVARTIAAFASRCGKKAPMIHMQRMILERQQEKEKVRSHLRRLLVSNTQITHVTVYSCS